MIFSVRDSLENQLSKYSITYLLWIFLTILIHCATRVCSNSSSEFRLILCHAISIPFFVSKALKDDWILLDVGGLSPSNLMYLLLGEISTTPCCWWGCCCSVAAGKICFIGDGACIDSSFFGVNSDFSSSSYRSIVFWANNSPSVMATLTRELNFSYCFKLRTDPPKRQSKKFNRMIIRHISNITITWKQIRFIRFVLVFNITTRGTIEIHDYDSTASPIIWKPFAANEKIPFLHKIFQSFNTMESCGPPFQLPYFLIFSQPKIIWIIGKNYWNKLSRRHWTKNLLLSV